MVVVVVVLLVLTCPRAKSSVSLFLKCQENSDSVISEMEDLEVVRLRY